tara:strand:+ start:1307 stop:1690 length:384 start_codon:yes stop_codon:yes gene_type:complete
MNWNTPGVDEMQMHRGGGFLIPDEIREQIITMDAQGMEVEDIIGMGMPEDVVSQVLIESKVEGRNPAQAMQPMKFPQGQSMAGNYPSSPQDEIAKSFNTEMTPQQQMPQQAQDPRMMDIMNPRFNRY